MSTFSRRQVIGGAGSAILVGGTAAAKAAPNTTSNLTADVCIVGAGFAGLSAALRLKQAGASVVVLEARGQVGGRSWTVSMKDGGWVDWGGQWVGSSQERFYSLIKEMGCETYPSPNFGKTLQRSIYDINEYYRINEDADEAFPGSDVLKGIYKQLDAIADTVDVSAPWSHPDGKLLNSVTFAEWLRNNVPHAGARQFAAAEVGSVPCASPEEISVLHLAWLIKACHGIDELFGDAQADRLIGGTQSGRPAGGRAAQGRDQAQPAGAAHPVERHRCGGAVRQYFGGGAARHRLRAAEPRRRHRVCARADDQPDAGDAALAAGARRQGVDGLQRAVLARRRPQRHVLRPPLADGRDRRIPAIRSNIPRPASSPASSIPTTRARSRRFRPKRAKACCSARSPNASVPKALEPVNYHESNWTEAQWTRGCFTGFLTPGATTLFGSAVRDPVGPIHWAGTETSTDWPSFIDGAIRSGEREAELIRKLG